MDIQSAGRAVGFAGACVVTAVIGIASVAVAAQIKPLGPDQPQIRPKLVVTTILNSSDVSDAQKAQVTTIVERHRSEIQSVPLSDDPSVRRETMRGMMQEIIQVLTPDQRDLIKAAVRKALANQQ